VKRLVVLLSVVACLASASSAVAANADTVSVPGSYSVKLTLPRGARVTETKPGYFEVTLTNKETVTLNLYVGTFQKAVNQFYAGSVDTYYYGKSIGCDDQTISRPGGFSDVDCIKGLQVGVVDATVAPRARARKPA